MAQRGAPRHGWHAELPRPRRGVLPRPVSKSLLGDSVWGSPETVTAGFERSRRSDIIREAGWNGNQSWSTRGVRMRLIAWIATSSLLAAVLTTQSPIVPKTSGSADKEQPVQATAQTAPGARNDWPQWQGPNDGTTQGIEIDVDLEAPHCCRLRHHIDIDADSIFDTDPEGGAESPRFARRPKPSLPGVVFYCPELLPPGDYQIKPA